MSSSVSGASAAIVGSCSKIESNPPSPLERLKKAVEEGNLDNCITALTTVNADELNSQDQNNENKTFLMIAIEKGYLEIAMKLVDYKAVLKKDSYGNSALIYLLNSYRQSQSEKAQSRDANTTKVFEDFCSTLKMLIEANCDFNTTNYLGENALFCMIRLLKTCHADVTLQNKLITLFFEQKFLARTTNLMQEQKSVGTFLHECVTDRTSNGSDRTSNGSEKPLPAYFLEMILSDLILSQRSFSLETKNKQGLTPFMLAVQNNAFEQANVLKKFGADVNATNTEGRTMLHLAQDFRQFKFLLDLEASFNISNASGIPLLSEVIKGSNSNKYAMVENLLRNGANVNAIDKNGKTVLMYAVEKNDVTLVSQLLAYGADPDLSMTLFKVRGALRLAYNVTALDIALEHKRRGTDIEQLIVDLSFHQLKKIITSNMTGAKKKLLIENLLKRGAYANIKDYNGESLVAIARRYSVDECVVSLLKRYGAQE